MWTASKSWGIVAAALSVLTIASTGTAQYNDGSGTAVSKWTSTYQFLPDQSTITQIGGIAGIHRTYTITGTFQLTADFEAGTASFDRVDANAVDDSPERHTLDPNEVFNMTDLAGVIIDRTTIQFEGTAADGSTVLITLSFADHAVALKGQTTPPPNSADFFLFTLDAVAQRKYSGGRGVPNDPYQIATAEDLMLLGETPEDYGKHFIMTADIDLDPNLPGRKAFDRAVIAPDVNDTERWFQGTGFTGVLDGDGHRISHLTIQGGDFLGLFGWLASGAQVMDLGIVEANIAGSGRLAGALVGWSSGSVTRCYSTGVVSGGAEVGGLMGENMGTVAQSYSTAAVRGGAEVGGLVGLLNAPWGTVTQCYSAGPTNGGPPVGGLIGWSSGPVTDCFWDTQTSGQSTSAGGAGKTTAEMQKTSTFRGWGTCGNGGVWTINEGNDYPRLWWECQPGETIRMPILPDLLLGTGTEDDPFLIYTAEELNTIGLFPCEWNKHFKLMEDIDLSSFDGKEGRPPFNMIAPGVLGGLGLFFWGTPFTGVFDGNSHTISHLTVMVNDGGCAGLVGGLDSGAQIQDLGVIDVNVTSSGSGVGGLAGVLGGYSPGVTVTRCYTTGIVRGKYSVGGLAGANGGIVTQCQSTGAVIAGVGSVGGLVGTNGGAITQSYSTGTIDGGEGVGGLVGTNGVGEINARTGEVTDCYSTAAVTGGWGVGGFMGDNVDGSISMSYSSGSVSGTGWGVGGLIGSGGENANATASFWDIQTSGQTSSAGGTGKTTAEMQTAKTFLDAGWDFAGETVNGTEDIWWILEGKDYPRLWWEAK